MPLERGPAPRAGPLLTSVILLLSSFCLSAQGGGQVCVQAFDDRNQNGARDAGEVAIQRGVGAHLLNRHGVAIATGLLEDSAYAADGLLCFDQLPAGEYQVRVTSSEYILSGATALAASVEPGLPPVRLDIGVRPIGSAAADGGASGAIDFRAAEGLVLAAGAGIGMVLLMGILGVLLWFLAIRRRAGARSARRPAQRVAL